MIAPNPAWTLPSIPGHEGIEGDWWFAWNLDAPVLLPAVLLGYLYWRGVGRMRRHHSRWHSVAFFSGLAAFVLAIESPIDRLGEHHFTFHMVQHEIFILLGAPLLLLGAPLTPLLLGMPRWARRNLVHPLARSTGLHSFYRWLTWPPASTLLLAAPFVAWHLMPGWFDAALRSDPVHDVQHLTFVTTALIFWLPVIDSKPLRSRLSDFQRLAYQLPMIATRIGLGLILALASEPFYEAYAEAEPVFDSLTGMFDQVNGVAVMWMFGITTHILVAAFLFDRMTEQWGWGE